MTFYNRIKKLHRITTIWNFFVEIFLEGIFFCIIIPSEKKNLLYVEHMFIKAYNKINNSWRGNMKKKDINEIILRLLEIQSKLMKQS